MTDISNKQGNGNNRELSSVKQDVNCFKKPKLEVIDRGTRGITISWTKGTFYKRYGRFPIGGVDVFHAHCYQVFCSKENNIQTMEELDKNNYNKVLGDTTINGGRLNEQTRELTVPQADVGPPGIYYFNVVAYCYGGEAFAYNSIQEIIHPIPEKPKTASGVINIMSCNIQGIEFPAISCTRQEKQFKLGQKLSLKTWVVPGIIDPETKDPVPQTWDALVMQENFWWWSKYQ